MEIKSNKYMAVKETHSSKWDYEKLRRVADEKKTTVTKNNSLNFQLLCIFFDYIKFILTIYSLTVL